MKTERELFEEWIRSVWLVDATWDESKNTYNESRVHCMWSAWCASAQRDGYKLVPVADINEFYQDDVEPEIFCEHESDFDSLGDCTELDEIMIVNKYTSARLKKETLYGVWCKCEKKAPYFKETEFKLFSNKDDARKAMIGASE